MNFKSIGIFGDSYGAASVDGDEILAQKGMEHHWSTLLAKEHNSNVTNYSKSGSSIYFSYKNFIENHHKHDLNIFLITSHYRYTKFVKLPSDNRERYISTHLIKYAREHWGELNLTDTDKEIVDMIDSWYKASDLEYIHDSNTLMILDVYRKRPDTLFIPCFIDDSDLKLYPMIGITADFCMSDLFYHQNINLGIDNNNVHSDYDENPELISGHLIPEYNKVAFELINNRLITGKWNWKIPKNISIQHRVEDYFIFISRKKHESNRME